MGLPGSRPKAPPRLPPKMTDSRVSIQQENGMTNTRTVMATGRTLLLVASGLPAACGVLAQPAPGGESAERVPAEVPPEPLAPTAAPDPRLEALVLSLPRAVQPGVETSRWPTLQPALLAFDELRYLDAAILLEDLRRRYPDTPELTALHGYALLEAGELRGAERLAWTGMETGGLADDTVAYLLACSLAGQERYRDALPWFRAAVEGEDDPALLEAAARCALEAGQGAFAVECLDRRAQKVAPDAATQRLRARALGLAGDLPGARKAYQGLLAVASDDPTLWSEAGLIDFQGALEGAEGFRFEEAARCFREAGDRDPQNARYHYNRGCALDWAEESAEAESAYLRAVELDPGHLQAAENLADLLLRQGRPDDAGRVLRQLLRQPLTAEERRQVEGRLQELRAQGPATSAKPSGS